MDGSKQLESRGETEGAQLACVLSHGVDVSDTTDKRFYTDFLSLALLGYDLFSQA